MRDEHHVISFGFSLTSTEKLISVFLLTPDMDDNEGDLSLSPPRQLPPLRASPGRPVAGRKKTSRARFFARCEGQGPELRARALFLDAPRDWPRLASHSSLAPVTLTSLGVHLGDGRHQLVGRRL
jgi:hypothetical protein